MSSCKNISCCRRNHYSEKHIPQSLNNTVYKHFPNLKTVALDGGSYDQKTLDALWSSAESDGLEFGIVIRGEIHPITETSLQIENITDAELEMLPYLRELKTLALKNPAAEPGKIFSLQEQLSGGTLTEKHTPIRWRCLNCGYTYDSTRACDPCPVCGKSAGWQKGELNEKELIAKKF